MPAARQTDAPPTQALPSYAPSPSPPPPIPSSQYLPLKLIVIAGVMVVLGAVILLLVLKKKTPTTTSTTTTSTRPSSQTPQSSPDTHSSPTEPTDLFSSETTDAAQSSPTATYKAVYAAMKNKDAAAFKRAMTKKDLQTIEESAKAADQSSDEILKQVLSFTPLPSSDESRNEIIDGDEATLEVRNALDEWETVHFVKEDGRWKMK